MEYGWFVDTVSALFLKGYMAGRFGKEVDNRTPISRPTLSETETS